MNTHSLLLHADRHDVPYLAQSEGSECALACLAMVGWFHGYKVGVTGLRQRHAISLKGATLKQVIQIAESIGLTARPIRCEIDELRNISLPAILHWDLNHYVVLVRITDGRKGTRYHVHDPAKGKQVIAAEDFSRHFTGVLLEVAKSHSFRPKFERNNITIGQLWTSIRGFWSSVRQLAALSIILQTVVIINPFFLQVAIDTVFPSFDGDLLLVLAVGFAGIALIDFLAGWLRSIIINNLNNSLSYQVIANLFNHLVHLPLSWFEKRHVGDIVSRFGSTQPISTLLSQGMISGVIDGVMAILTMAIMLFYSWKLALIPVVAGSIFASLRFGFIQVVRLRNIDAISTTARENSAFIETVRGIAGIKAFGQESNRQRIWQDRKAEAINAQIRLGKVNAHFDALGQFVLGIEKVVFVFVAIKMAMASAITLGIIFAFISYRQHFLDAIIRFVSQVINFKLIHLHLARISDVVLSPPENSGADGTLDAVDFSNGLLVNDVRFKYGANEPEVLKGVSLKVNPGEMLALVGPSGGGKTTLLKVMMGLLEPSWGQVQVGHRMVTGSGVRSYRRRVGSVAQDDVLYAGSLAENIAFFDPELDMERVKEVAAMACVHEEIARMPLQYDTLVGDMGSALSGGQKQRVLLARALYARPDILFLDEATAHLDPDMETKVLESLEALKIMRVVIAHRSRAISSADRIFHVVDGRVVLQRGLVGRASS